MSDIIERAEEGCELYRRAERDWEFHDSSHAFNAFIGWIEGNFEGLVAALKAARAEKERLQALLKSNHIAYLDAIGVEHD